VEIGLENFARAREVQKVGPSRSQPSRKSKGRARFEGESSFSGRKSRWSGPSDSAGCPTPKVVL
jgi:hypothetical protein